MAANQTNETEAESKSEKNPSAGKGLSSFLEKGKQIFDDPSTYLKNTFIIGLIVMVTLIIAFPISIGKPKEGLMVFSVLFVAVASSFISGFFLGFLFGIPKKSNVEADNSGYLLNTNLTEISDWLTKIVVGMGLIEIKEIPGLVQSIGFFIAQNISCDANLSNDIKIVVNGSVVFCAVFGLYYGYNYTRLFLSGEYKKADENLLREKDEVIQAVVDNYNQKNDATQSTFSKSFERFLSYEVFNNLVQKAKDKMANGLKVQENIPNNLKDPQKGQWGGQNEKDNIRLWARVETVNNSNELFKVLLEVSSLNNLVFLQENSVVIFALHNTFKNPIKAVTPKSGIAKLELLVYGSFTVGALVYQPDGSEIELELDLAALPNVPKEFKER